MRLMRSIMAVFAVLVLGLGAAQADAPVKLRTGWVVVPPEMVPILFLKPDLARHLGHSYDFEPIRFGSSSPMIQAMSSGDIDIATFTYFSLGAAIENAKIEDLRVMFDEFRDGQPGWFSAKFLVRRDSGINTVQDLKGKVLASFGIGSGGDVAMRVFLRKNGLEDVRDYTVIQVPPPNQKAMLTEGKVDLISGQGILYYDPDLQKIAKPLFSYADGMGPTEMGVYTARAGFIAQHRAALVDFAEDMIRSVRWYTDPEHHAEAIQILSDFTKLSPDHFESWAFTHKDEYRDPGGRPDLDSLQHALGILRTMDLLKSDIDIKKYADLSIIDEAGKRLK